ncbi:MAG: DUF485 domain-containing protein [Pseudonocardiaceae bacterium]
MTVTLEPEADRWIAAQNSHEFVGLRTRLRTFVFPTAALFFAWYFAYVLLAAYAPAFMATKLGGSNLTIGFLMGLSQFVTTFAITTFYVVYASRRLDPVAAGIRDDIEADRGDGGHT